MKGLILALLWFIIFLAATTCLLRVRRWEKPFKLFLGVFGATLPLFALCYRFTPRDLYVLPERLLERCAAVDLLYGLGVYALLFHNFWDFVYAGPMGFSAGVMVQLENAGERGCSTEEVIVYFKDGQGMDRIFGRRIPNLLAGGYLVMVGDTLRLTRKGRCTATLTLFLKKLICAGEGG